MSSNWANNLDMLAQSGVLNFDAPAYIMGQSPRYVGNPGMVPPITLPAEESMLPSSPRIDEFKPNNKKFDSENTNPSWKKWLLGIAGVATLAVGGFAAYKLITKGWKGLRNAFKSTPKVTPAKSEGFFKSIKTKISNGYNTVKHWFSKSNDKNVWKVTKKFFSENWSKLTKLFK